MSQPFVGQLQAFGFAFAPEKWALCSGQILPISQYSALFALLGTMYGGNGTSNFQLPNLQSRVPMHFGTSPGGTVYMQGTPSGAENITLDVNTIPNHNHNFSGSSANAAQLVPAVGTGLAKINSGTGTPDKFYGPDTTLQPLNPGSVGPFGSDIPHTNIQPFLVITWCIALHGDFPARN